MLSNTMRFGTDSFSFNPRGYIVSKTPIDTTGQAAINGFSIEGVEPSGSIRTAVFKIDDLYYYFPNIVNGEAVPVEFPYEITIDNLLNYGTPLSNLSTITSVSNWTGLQIYPIIALQASSNDSASIPTAKIGIKSTTSTDQLSKTEETAEYEFATEIGSKASIIDVTAKTTITGSASISIRAQLRNSGEWSSDYQLSELKTLEAEAIKFKITYTVSALNSETAKVDNIQIKYSSGGSGAVAGYEADIVTIEQNYENGLRFAQATLRHNKLVDSEIAAYVSFRSQPLERTLIEIGSGTGEVYTYNLKPSNQDDNDARVDPTSLRIFVDGIEKTGFNFNSGTSQVTLVAPENSVVAASYLYNIEEEIWREMEMTSVEPYKDSGLYATRFEYSMPDDENGKPIACVKFVLNRPAGDVTNEFLGIGTGLTQTFVLPHKARIDTIRIPNAEFSYDEDSQMLRVIAQRGNDLLLSYCWTSESQEIRGFTVGFAAI